MNNVFIIYLMFSTAVIYLQNGGSETRKLHEGHLSSSSILVKAHAPMLDAAISLTSS